MSTCIDVLGLAVEVVVDAEPAAEHVRNLLRGFSEPQGRSRTRALRITAPLRDAAGHALFDGKELMADGMSAPVAIRALFWHLNRLAMRTRDYTVLHAGAVATGDQAVVLSAPTESGKSTLVAALVRQGFEYLSDELAPLATGDGKVRPYRCPLGLDPGSFPLFPDLRPSVPAGLQDGGHWFVPPSGAGRHGPEGVMPGAVVFPCYRRGARCRLTPVDPKAALALAANEALNIVELRRVAYANLCHLVRTTPAFRLVFDQLDDACAAVRDALGTSGA